MKFDIYTTFISVMILDVVISLCNVIFVNPIMSVMRVDEPIRAQTALYFCIYMSGFVFIQIHYLLVTIFQSIGISIFQMIISIIGAIINILGNIASAVFLPKEIAVAGFAVFSVLSAVITDAIMLFKLKKSFAELKLEKEKYVFKFSKTRIICHFGFPSMLQQFIMYISALLLSPIINNVGYSAIAGYTVANKVYSIVSNTYGAVSKVLSTFIAQCAGARKYYLIKKGFLINFAQCAALTVPLIAVLAIFADEICGLFFNSADFGKISHRYATDFVRYFLPFSIMNMFAHEVHSYCRGIVRLK